MKRALMTALTAALVTGIAAAGPPSSNAEARLLELHTEAPTDARPTDWRSEHCRYASRDERQGWSVDEVKATLRCSGRRWGGDVDLALRIVGCESGFHADAENTSSSAGGVWQAVDSTFESWYGGARELVRRWELKHWKLNGRTNAVLGYRVFTYGTGPWSASKWCWG